MPPLCKVGGGLNRSFFLPIMPIVCSFHNAQNAAENVFDGRRIKSYPTAAISWKKRPIFNAIFLIKYSALSLFSLPGGAEAAGSASGKLVTLFIFSCREVSEKCLKYNGWRYILYYLLKSFTYIFVYLSSKLYLISVLCLC